MPVRLGTDISSASPGYEAQELQLPELQPEQEWFSVPATDWGTPLALVVKAAKEDILRLAGLWHLGHSASWPDWLKGRICSNLESHAEQTYSYIGI
jgi:hypothetical protein